MNEIICILKLVDIEVSGRALQSIPEKIVSFRGTTVSGEVIARCKMSKSADGSSVLR